MDFAKSIPLIEKKIQYSFRDKSLLTQAFTRTSFCNEKNYKGRESYSSNEVLEFFGDSVLSCAIISLLLERKTERYSHGIKTALTEGDLSAIRSKLSDKRHLSSRTAELGLQRFLLLGEGDEKLGIANEASVMEDLFESIIGAIYIDCGMDIKTVIDVVSKLIDVSVYADGEAPIQSYKNALQEWCASKKHRLPAPVYKTLSESGPEHKRIFERGCYIGEKLCGVGTGKNQKEADTLAAKEALKTLSLSKPSAVEEENSLDALRALLAAKKAPSPEFHDLGEAPNSEEGERRYIVECSAMGISASGIGYSKRDARAEAAKKVLSELQKAHSKKNIEADKKENGKSIARAAKRASEVKKASKATEKRKAGNAKAADTVKASVEEKVKAKKLSQKQKNDVQKLNDKATRDGMTTSDKKPRRKLKKKRVASYQS